MLVNSCIGVRWCSATSILPTYTKIDLHLSKSISSLGTSSFRSCFLRIINLLWLRECLHSSSSQDIILIQKAHQGHPGLKEINSSGWHISNCEITVPFEWQRDLSSIAFLLLVEPFVKVRQVFENLDWWCVNQIFWLVPQSDRVAKPIIEIALTMPSPSSISFERGICGGILYLVNSSAFWMSVALSLPISTSI